MRPYGCLEIRLGYLRDGACALTVPNHSSWKTELCDGSLRIADALLRPCPAEQEEGLF